MTLSCRFLVDQLRHRLTQDAAISARAGHSAKEAAQSSATAMEKKQDGRVMIEQSNLAFAHARRVEATRQALRALDGFVAPPPTQSVKSVALGAIIDAITEDETGEIGRTFVMLPVGAGEELTGPGGDGIITVITPSSPVGRAMLGKHRGDVIDVTIRGEPVEWEILDVS